MSPRRIHARVSPNRFPRVSGDEPTTKMKSRYLAMFSPRERG